MVTRSIDNWEEHKKDVYHEIKKIYGESRAQKFIKFYAQRYDRYNRSFIPYRLAFWLYDDYMYIQNTGTKFIGFVGVGGTGKTTLMKNVLYFLDDKFDNDMMVFDVDGFVKCLSKLDKVGAKRSLGLDEPDDQYHMASKEGKQFRKILGKCRQQQMALGFCATDLKDIPTYIFRKLDGIFFMPYLGKAMFFKNRAKNQAYVIQDIRNKYTELGYKTFYRFKSSSGCLSFKTIKYNPFDMEYKKTYLYDKAKDYDDSINDFIKIKKGETPKAVKDPRISIIARMKNDKIKVKDIASYLSISTTMLRKIMKKDVTTT